MTAEELRRRVFYLNGLYYSFEMADVSARRLRETVDAIACLQEAGNQSECDVASALLDAWTIVDMCHRVRGLIQETPSVSKREPVIKVFFLATDKVEELRNYVQHLRSEIPKRPIPSTPIWGVVSWVPTHDQATCYSMFTGNLVSGVEGHTVSLDTQEGRFTSQLTLSAGNVDVDLAALAQSLTTLRAFVREWIDKKGEFKRGAKTLILKLRVKARVV